MLDIQTKENGYTEIIPPLMGESASRFTAYITTRAKVRGRPVLGEEITDYGLIPTAAKFLPQRIFIGTKSSTAIGFH